MADVRPSTHPDGVLRSVVKLDEGLYRVIIASEKQNLLRRPQYLLRVHMIDYQNLVRSIAGPLIGLLFAGWLAYKLIRSKWVQKWRTAPVCRRPDVSAHEPQRRGTATCRVPISSPRTEPSAAAGPTNPR